MLRRARMILFGVLVCLSIGATFQIAAAQDPIAVSPNNFKLEIDNPWVRVLRLKLGPHEKTPAYQTLPSVTVYLTAADQKMTAGGGKSSEMKHQLGEASYADAGTRSLENMSSEPMEEIIVELKPEAPKGNGLPAAELDPVKVEPDYAKVLFENDRVRVLHTVLGAHVKNPLHAHPHNVVVFAIAPATVTTPDGKTSDNPRKAGVVRWAEATQHATGNNTDKDTLEIQVELK
jgi:hypothetical protein